MLSVLAVAAAMVFPASSGAVDFSAMKPVSDSELEQIRGGFITSSGMQVDFGLTTRTVVDGVLLREININSVAPDEIDPALLQTVITVNGAGAAVENLSLNDLPRLLTVIQNNSDNKVIQNFNILDVDATNVQAFRTQQALGSEFNHQIVQALR